MDSNLHMQITHPHMAQTQRRSSSRRMHRFQRIEEMRPGIPTIYCIRRQGRDLCALHRRHIFYRRENMRRTQHHILPDWILHHLQHRQHGRTSLHHVPRVLPTRNNGLYRSKQDWLHRGRLVSAVPMHHQPVSSARLARNYTTGCFGPADTVL